MISAAECQQINRSWKENKQAVEEALAAIDCRIRKTLERDPAATSVSGEAPSDNALPRVLAELRLLGYRTTIQGKPPELTVKWA